MFQRTHRGSFRILGRAQTVAGISVLATVTLIAGRNPRAAEFQDVTCQGAYTHHLQGVCTDERQAIFWCFTTKLVKTDAHGQVLQQIDVGNHHGDLCFHDGLVYVAVNFGKFNDPNGNADSWIYVYDAADLAFRAKHPVPEVVHGAGGIALHDGRFLVVGGLPPGVDHNLVYEYDAQFKFVKRHELAGGYTLMGIQTAAFAGDHWWFGCYGDPKILLKADRALERVERFEFDCSLGIVPIAGGRFLVARGTSSKEQGHTGRLVVAEPDPKRGLQLVPNTRPADG